MDYQPAQGEATQPFGGNKMKRYSVPHELSGLEFALVYEAALTKAGWTIDHKIEEQGFLYAHYDKNGRNIYAYLRRGENVSFQVAEPPSLLTVNLKPPAKTPEKFGDKDDIPYLTPMPGWKLAGNWHTGGPLVVYPASGGKSELVGISAYITKMYTGEKADFSNAQFEKAYEQALVKAGWTIGGKIEDQGFLYAHYDKNGRNIWIYIRRSEHPTFFVADIGGGLKATLAKQCKVAVYGVNFDFNKSTLRPDAEPVLKQVLALFKEDRTLRAEIGGHTDNVGTPAYNLKLSDARAAAVKAWLVAHGVAAARLTTHGYGLTEPLVPNDSDANRAKNRRVELKKPNCK
jgi:OOP family OmpA-OmpF porin